MIMRKQRLQKSFYLDLSGYTLINEEQRIVLVYEFIRC